MKKLLLLSLLALGSVYGDNLDEEFNDITEAPNALLQLQAKAPVFQRFETYNVGSTKMNGATLHTATYLDGTVILTALDGPQKGYQEVYVNGVLETYNSTCQHGKDYFYHQYERGKVTTYSNRQIIELY